MPSTSFTDKETLIEADWLNEVNDHVFGDLKSLEYYGADPTGAVDSTAAIQAWLTYLSANGLIGTVGDGTFAFSGPITVGAASDWGIIGKSAATTNFVYNGATTTGDLWTIGSASENSDNVWFSNFTLYSETVMTSGIGLHLQRMCRSGMRDTIITGQDRTRGLWHGIRFNGLDQFYWSGFQAQAQRDAIQLNGLVSGPKAGLFLNHFKIAGSECGLRIGGAFGGVYLGEGDIIGNNTNICIDQTLVAENNREVFIGMCSIDSAGLAGDMITFAGIGVDIQETGGCFVLFDGTWVASAGTLIRCGSGYQGPLRLSGVTLFNAFTTYGGDGYGIELQNYNAQVDVVGSQFRNIEGVGVICTHATAASQTSITSCVFEGDVATKVTNLANTRRTTNYGGESNFGRVTFGTDATTATAVDGSPVVQFALNSANGGAVSLAHFEDNTALGWLAFSKSRSNTIGSHTIVQSGDPLGGIVFEGSDGANFIGSASINAIVNDTPSTNLMPSELVFRATDSSGTFTDVLRAGVGFVHIPLAASSPPRNNLDMSFQLASNTSLEILVRGSDGTVRKVALTLTP